MVSGNKGGVGKSLFCLSLASTLEHYGYQYSVLDGDGRAGDVYAAFKSKVPARQGDFRQLRPESHLCPYDAEYEDVLHKLLRVSSDLIVNTPDGADSMMLKWFDVTLKHTEDNGYQFIFIYMMSDRPDGLEMLVQLKDRFSFLYPVQNLHFGDQKAFTSFNRDYMHRFNSVIEFPRLRAEEVRMLFDLHTYPFEACNMQTQFVSTDTYLDTNRIWSHKLHADVIEKNRYSVYTLPALTRARISNWQSAMDLTILDIINNNVSNVETGVW